jgi:predicted outer membrane repeat protein
VSIDRSSKLFYNFAHTGGAIASEGGAVWLRYTNVFTNHATVNGGAIYCLNTELSLDVDTYLQNNRADRSGGGIFNEYGGVTTQNAFLLSNSAGFGGGGIDNEAGVVHVTDSEVLGNIAGYGGGIDNLRGTVEITRTSLNGNRAKFFGGGISNDETGVVEVTHSEFWGNSAGVTGGAISSFGDGVYVGTTVFKLNTPNAISHPYTDWGGNTFIQ